MVCGKIFHLKVIFRSNLSYALVTVAAGLWKVHYVSQSYFVLKCRILFKSCVLASAMLDSVTACNKVNWMKNWVSLFPLNRTKILNNKFSRILVPFTLTVILTHKLLDAMQFSCELRVWDFIVTEFYAIMQYVKMMQCSLLLSNFYQLKGINQNYNSVIIYSPSCCIILLIKAIIVFQWY